MKLRLKNYFEKHCVKNSELMGLKVVTLDGSVYYINDFDQMVNEDEMPKEFFVSKKLGSNYGKDMSHDVLYVEVD